MRSGSRALILALATLSVHLHAQKSPYDAVNPLIGTAGGGNTFPGATLPFGMIQFSPDTNSDAWYKYDEKTIRGISLAHISGAGCPLYGDFGVLPVAGTLQESPGRDFAPYVVGFDHGTEVARPGYYAVTLSNGVRVEVAVTERAGIARFTFPAGTPARLLVNAGSSANEMIGNGRQADNYENQIALTGPDAFTAWSRSGHFCSTASHYKIYAVGQFNKAFTTAALWQDDSIHPTAKTAQGKHSGAWLDFSSEHEVLLRVGISFVSAEGAKENLDREMRGWNFDRVHAAAKANWTELLNRFATQGGTNEQRTIFYTGVYHSFLAPNVFSDVDGRYMGFDGAVHTLVPGQHAQYANFSDWDIYRNTVQLQALFFPDEAASMMQSLVNDAEQGGQLPRWEAANDVTYVMNGDSPVPVIASSYAFGARTFDAATALKWMVEAATETKDNRERPYLGDYLRLGYVPTEKDASSASRTLEYASDDFAISQFAAALGDSKDAERFRTLSQNWKNLLDPETHWIRPRKSDGSWLEGFDAERSLPRRGNVPVPTDQMGFEEGNTYQYSFMVPFDYPALFASMGGEEKVTRRLDHFFVKLRCWGEPCYNIENEPDFVVPYAYVFAGQPWKTQDVVTRIGATTFKDTPDGIPGNDDLGATSGVYVWDALGMYPAVPGVGAVVLGTPMFTRATLRLAGGRTLVITRRGEGIYVKNVMLDGKPYPIDWLPMAKLRPGVTRLEFSTQAEPDTTRATKAGERPPSLP